MTDIAKLLSYNAKTHYLAVSGADIVIVPKKGALVQRLWHKLLGHFKIDLVANKISHIVDENANRLSYEDLSQLQRLSDRFINRANTKSTDKKWIEANATLTKTNDLITNKLKTIQLLTYLANAIYKDIDPDLFEYILKKIHLLSPELEQMLIKKEGYKPFTQTVNKIILDYYKEKLGAEVFQLIITQLDTPYSDKIESLKSAPSLKDIKTGNVTIPVKSIEAYATSCKKAQTEEFIKEQLGKLPESFKETHGFSKKSIYSLLHSENYFRDDILIEFLKQNDIDINDLLNGNVCFTSELQTKFIKFIENFEPIKDHRKEESFTFLQSILSQLTSIPEKDEMLKRPDLKSLLEDNFFLYKFLKPFLQTQLIRNPDDYIKKLREGKIIFPSDFETSFLLFNKHQISNITHRSIVDYLIEIFDSTILNQQKLFTAQNEFAIWKATRDLSTLLSNANFRDKIFIPFLMGQFSEHRAGYFTTKENAQDYINSLIDGTKSFDQLDEFTQLIRQDLFINHLEKAFPTIATVKWFNDLLSNVPASLKKVINIKEAYTSLDELKKDSFLKAFLKPFFQQHGISDFAELITKLEEEQRAYIRTPVTTALKKYIINERNKAITFEILHEHLHTLLLSPLAGDATYKVREAQQELRHWEDHKDITHLLIDSYFLSYVFKPFLKEAFGFSDKRIDTFIEGLKTGEEILTQAQIAKFQKITREMIAHYIPEEKKREH